MSEYELYINPQNLNMSPEDQERLAISMSRDALDSGRFSNLAGPHTRERRFAITERGYMGMVPPYSKTGDEVIIIPGALSYYDVDDAQTPLAEKSGNLLARATFMA
jgi:hypothetical protein